MHLNKLLLCGLLACALPAVKVNAWHVTGVVQCPNGNTSAGIGVFISGVGATTTDSNGAYIIYLPQTDGTYTVCVDTSTLPPGATVSGCTTFSVDSVNEFATVNFELGGDFCSTVCTITGVTISDTSWNKFPLPSGPNPVVWVNAHIGKPGGIPTTGVSTVRFSDVQLIINGTVYAMPDGLLTFDSSAPDRITTTFTGSEWDTTINPNAMSDEMFFVGAAIPVTPEIAAGGKATFTYNVESSVPGLDFPWQWSAAVYTDWPADWNDAMIQPYHSSFHAGTPLNTTVQKSLVQGPRGGGGSNFTGSWSATGHAACP